LIFDTSSGSIVLHINITASESNSKFKTHHKNQKGKPVLSGFALSKNDITNILNSCHLWQHGQE